MMHAARRLLSLLFLLWLAASASAQQKVLIPDRLERPTAVDDKGLTQWTEWKATPCQGCTGKGKVTCSVCERFAEDSKKCPDCKRVEGLEATCRMCAGSGELADPLLKVGCPGCLGAGFLLCTVCGGGGQLRVGEAKQWSACPSCRGDGGWKCGACNGARLVEPAALKPAMKDGNAKDLAKAMAAAEQALKELAAIDPKGGKNARKEVKAVTKVLDTAGGTFPPLKRLSKPFEDYLNKTFAGQQFQGSDENEAEAMKMVKTASEYYLKHQKRMLELAHKRAEANEKVLAAQKGK